MRLCLSTTCSVTSSPWGSAFISDSVRGTFRYPTKNDQTPSLQKVRYIDLAAFHNSMLRLTLFFDGAGTAVYEDARMRDEYEEWMREEYGNYGY